MSINDRRIGLGSVYLKIEDTQKKCPVYFSSLLFLFHRSFKIEPDNYDITTTRKIE